MSYQEPSKCVPIPEEDLQTVESLRNIITSATFELERITNRTLQKSTPKKEGKKKTTVVFTIEGDRNDVQWDTDDGTTCIDNEAKVCCSGPCPCS